MKIRQECGQKWYRFSSWRSPEFRKLYQPPGYIKGEFRVHIGWAFGPLMLFKNGIEV